MESSQVGVGRRGREGGGKGFGLCPGANINGGIDPRIDS